MNWRDDYPVHPAAEVFPMMSVEEIKALGEDISANGLQVPIVLWTDEDTTYVLDGRNRLDAMHTAGLDTEKAISTAVESNGDPWAFVISANLRRRHLTLEQRIGLHARLRTEGKSIREIAKLTGASKSTVDRDLATVPDGTVPERIVGLDGKDRPATALRITGKKLLVDEPVVDVSDADLRQIAMVRDMAGQGYSTKEMRIPVGTARKMAAEHGIAVPGDGPGSFTFHFIRQLTFLEIAEMLDHDEDGYRIDLAHLDELDALVVSEWVDSLTKSHRALGRLVKDMKGRGRG